MLYEKFNTPKPVGAGLLIQPTGLSVLCLLGLDKQIIESGSIIHQLYGKVSGSRFVTLDVKYKHIAPHLFGVGTYRDNLFCALYDKVIELGVSIKSSSEISDVLQANGKATLINIAGEQFGEYDLVVDASGAKSTLRKKYANIRLDKPYPYGAIWSIVKLSDTFRTDTLDQRYKNARHIIGVLPVGKLGGDACTSAAFFWSMRVKDYPKWREQEFSKWQDYVVSLWPETESLVSQFKTHDDLTMATYSDVILNSYNSGCLAFIGDSAHCTSPQLGQGANLALMDAMVLSDNINSSDSIEDALNTYSHKRKRHLRFYQMASRALTPFFQSDSLLFAKLRLLTCGMSCKIPFTQKIAAHVLTGTKTGLFTTLNPGDWAKDYDLFKASKKALID